MRIASPLLAITLLAAPIVAHAQNAPDAATLSAARELMAVTDIQAQMRAMGPRMAQAMGQQFQQMFVEKKVPEGLNRQFMVVMQDYLTSMDAIMTPEVVDEMAGIYARHFSIVDLKRLTALMHDPVMVKFRAQTPDFMAEMMPILLKAMQPRQDALQIKIKQIIADWIAQHPDDQAKLRSPIQS